VHVPDKPIHTAGLVYNNNHKTKVMISGEWQKVTQNAVRWPCGVCRRGVGNNSIQCTSYKNWVHRKCSGIKGRCTK